MFGKFSKIESLYFANGKKVEFYEPFINNKLYQLLYQSLPVSQLTKNKTMFYVSKKYL